VLPFGAGTAAAFEVVDGLSGKLDQFFALCDLLGQGPVAEARLAVKPEDLAVLDVNDPTAIRGFLREAALGPPNRAGVLDLEAGVNPLFVDGAGPAESAAEFKRMAEEAQALGLKLMVDLVVSHCAFDSELITEHPGWFRKEHGKIVHPFCMENRKKVVWKDLAQFDHKHAHDKEGLFQYLLRVVQFLADLGIKGFRCDAAYQVPASFWRRT